MSCPMCKRDRPLTVHHLIPQTCHKNKWFKKRFNREELNVSIGVCRDCHSAIHKFIPNEKKLGRDYSTLKSLMGHQVLAKYVEWVGKQKRSGRFKVKV